MRHRLRAGAWHRRRPVPPAPQAQQLPGLTLIATFQSWAVLVQAYAVPLIIAFLIGLATAYSFYPRGSKAPEEPKVKDLRDL